MKGGAFLDHFFVNLIPNGYYDYEENEVLPAHELILRPLLLCAKECYVYGLKKDTELFQQCTDILSFTRNKYKLDLKKEVIEGYEQLMKLVRPLTYRCLKSSLLPLKNYLRF